MQIHTGAIRVFHSSQVEGLNGDNGEEWVVFMRDNRSLLASSWVWCRIREEAEEIAAKAHAEVPDWERL